MASGLPAPIARCAACVITAASISGLACLTMCYVPSEASTCVPTLMPDHDMEPCMYAAGMGADGVCILKF